MGMKRTHVFLPQPVISRLKALAKKTGLPVSELIRRAIDEYLERLQRKANHLDTVIDQEVPHGWAVLQWRVHRYPRTGMDAALRRAEPRWSGRHLWICGYEILPTGKLSRRYIAIQLDEDKKAVLEAQAKSSGHTAAEEAGAILATELTRLAEAQSDEPAAHE